jgi:hypothetical protein
MNDDNDNDLVGLVTYSVRYFDKEGNLTEEKEFDFYNFDKKRSIDYGKPMGYDSMTVGRCEIIADEKL